MELLFPEESLKPPGLEYIPDFISPKDEEYLIREISGIDLHTFVFHGYEAKRKVASFGYDYSFEKRSVTPGKAIPDTFTPLLVKVAKKTGVESRDFAELLITEYPTGAVINWHRDAPPFDIIAGISLLADCTFRFRPHEKSKQTRGAIVSVVLKRRSLYIMRGEARTSWQHSTLPVKSKRFSITLRTLKAGLQEK